MFTANSVVNTFTDSFSPFQRANYLQYYCLRDLCPEESELSPPNWDVIDILPPTGDNNLHLAAYETPNFSPFFSSSEFHSLQCDEKE